MKKSIISLFTVVVLIFGSLNAVSGNHINTNASLTNTEFKDPYMDRLLEIKKMTKKDLSNDEKKQLRKEVIAIKKQRAAEGGYIYISVGAAIIIVLLLILLL